MTQFATFCYCLSFILLIAPFASGDSSRGVSLAEPPDKSLVEGKLLPVVIHLNRDDVDRVIISRNNREIENVSTVKGKRYICKTIPIDFGLNIINIRAVTAGKTVESKEVTVFCRSDISNMARKHPPDFQEKPFHTDGRDETCRPCHKMEVTQRDLRPEKPEDSSCYACHSKIVLFNYVHGPAARWTCLTCHDKDSRPSKFATQQPDSTSCFACHGDAKAAWAAKKYVHGPTATGKCTVCHNPHASDNPFWIRKQAWNLCVSCHEDMAKESHVLKPFALVSKGHPTRGVRDPSRPGKMLTCASCHSPHVSNMSSLLALEEGNIYSFCNKCHNN